MTKALLSERLMLAIHRRRSMQPKLKKITALTIAKVAGVSPAAASFWFNDINGISGVCARRLADFLMVDPVWLETGDVDHMSRAMRDDQVNVHPLARGDRAIPSIQTGATKEIGDSFPGFGSRLTHALQLAGKDRHDLASAIDVSVQALSQVIAGKTKALTAENAALAARFLGVDMLWLATGIGKPVVSRNKMSDLNGVEGQLVTLFRLLTDEERDALLTRANHLVTEKQRVSSSANNPAPAHPKRRTG